jgi:hypothetical protein
MGVCHSLSLVFLSCIAGSEPVLLYPIPLLPIRTSHTQAYTTRSSHWSWRITHSFRVGPKAVAEWGVRGSGNGWWIVDPLFGIIYYYWHRRRILRLLVELNLFRFISEVSENINEHLQADFDWKSIWIQEKFRRFPFVRVERSVR